MLWRSSLLSFWYNRNNSSAQEHLVTGHTVNGEFQAPVLLYPREHKSVTYWWAYMWPGSHQVVRGASDYLSFGHLLTDYFTTQYTVSGATPLYWNLFRYSSTRVIHCTFVQCIKTYEIMTHFIYICTLGLMWSRLCFRCTQTSLGGDNGGFVSPMSASHTPVQGNGLDHEHLGISFDLTIAVHKTTPGWDLTAFFKRRPTMVMSRWEEHFGYISPRTGLLIR